MFAETSRRLRELFTIAVAAAMPADCLQPLPSRRVHGQTIVLGAGKAAASMAAAFENSWGLPVEGLVVTRHGHDMPTRYIEVVTAAHPVPDTAGQLAARRIFNMAKTATAADLVIFLGSGGASALLALPAPGISLDDKRTITAALLKSGAPISEMNIVRRAMSSVKGGRLAAACAPAKLITYLISDVPGDDPAVIGSGPTVPAGNESGDPFTILAQRDITVPPTVLTAMRANKPPFLSKPPDVHVIVTAKEILATAARTATEWGWQPILLGDDLEGEAQEVARTMAVMARRMMETCKSPIVLISGGETTVTVRGAGQGGRNQEFLLALSVELEGAQNIHAIACDTDGLDGTTADAGALINPTSLARMRAAGIDPIACLATNDANRAFAAVDDLVTTGPTRTNVNDFRAILIEPTS